MPIEREEFQAAVTFIRDDIAQVNARLDTLNGLTRTNEKAIAVLEDRSHEGRRHAAAWGGFVGGVLMVAGWLAEKLWK